MDQLDGYATFNDIRLNKPPDGYQMICVHLVFDIKHDGCHKARLVIKSKIGH